MAYIKLHDVKQLDFQINRILTYGDSACDFGEVRQAAAQIKDLNDWDKVWKELGEKAEKENRFLHSAYYFRLAEFFLKDGEQKQKMYESSISNFTKIISKDKSIKTEYVPYNGTAMKTLVFTAEKPKGDIVAFGGYDSFIEEFYLAIKDISKQGYNVYLFEGCGQGSSLRKGLYFEPHWENPTKAVLDYFNLDNVSVVGISWGGYFALRAAAFDKRIKRAAAYDVLYDGFDCMTNALPKRKQFIFKILFSLGAKSVVNRAVKKQMQKNLIADWAVSHGQYITNTKSPFEFYQHLKTHTLKGIEKKIDCDVLLLAGENDHYIPKPHFYKLKKSLVNARTLTSKMFTKQEGGQEHCQIGNHKLATYCILNWLDSFKNES